MTRAETIRAALATARKIKINLKAKEGARREMVAEMQKDAERDRRRLDILRNNERRLWTELLAIEAQAETLADPNR